MAASQETLEGTIIQNNSIQESSILIQDSLLQSIETSRSKTTDQTPARRGLTRTKVFEFQAEPQQYEVTRPLLELYRNAIFKREVGNRKSERVSVDGYQSPNSGNLKEASFTPLTPNSGAFKIRVKPTRGIKF